MRILVVCTTDSMIYSFLVPYIKELEKDGNYVECASSITGNYFTNLQEQYNIKMNEINFNRTPWSLDNLKAYKKLNNLIETKKFDTIFCHEPVGGALGRLSGHKYKCRVIYMVHGFHFFKGASKLRWMIFYPIEKFMCRYTDMLITINNEDFSFAKSHFNLKRIVKFPGIGVNTAKFRPVSVDREKKCRELGIQNDSFIL